MASNLILSNLQVVSDDSWNTTFVLLDLDDDLLKDHIANKYKGRGDVAEIQKMVVKMSKLFDDADESEKNTLTFKMTKEKCAEENAIEVLELLGNPVVNATEKWPCSGAGGLLSSGLVLGVVMVMTSLVQ